MRKTTNADTAVVDSDLIDVRSRIFTIRGVQVMLDRDLAELYGVEVKHLNRQVKRNIQRFPDDFMYKLTQDERKSIDKHGSLKCQIGTSSWGGDRQLPYAFTENGIAMLSGVLRSEKAIEINIRIMRAFVSMRKALASLAPLLNRIETVEQKLILDQARNEDRFKMILDAMQDKTFPPQKVFFDGAIFDADVFATKHILSATKSILLIDSWVDIVTLDMLAKKTPGVAVEIVSSLRGNKLAASDVEKFNAQYGGLTVRTSTRFHDRFLVVDDGELYLIGASLKDLGRKCFAFAKLDPSEIPTLKARL